MSVRDAEQPAAGAKKKKKNKKQKGKKQNTKKSESEAATAVLQPKRDERPAHAPEPEPEAEPEAEPVELSATSQQLAALATVPMEQWSGDQVLEWVNLVELPAETRAVLHHAFADDETDGEDLATLVDKRLRKMLKKAALPSGDFADASRCILALRDQLLTATKTRRPSSSHLRCDFDRQRDRLGSGTFGHVFICKLDGEGDYAVKRVDAIKAKLVTKEIEALQTAAQTDQGGHRNVVHYYGKDEDADFVYIYMELCDYTRAPRGGLVPRDLVDWVSQVGPGPLPTEAGLRTTAQLFAGIEYLHRHGIVHRDLKPTNILFKGSCLKICDMGQSRVLVGGASVAETDSRGGTEGWRSPEELKAEEEMRGRGGVFQSRRSSDIHPAGSLMFYILMGGQHAFGTTYREQQHNILKGKAVNLLALRSKCADACDLFTRMTCVEPRARLVIEKVLDHPALWDPQTKLRKVCEWAKSWERGTPALQRRLDRHAAAVKRMFGAGGWLAQLDKSVQARLLAHGRYNGHAPTELLRAVRNISEHWFTEGATSAGDDEALAVLTQCSAEETRRGQASADAASRRAVAIVRYFFTAERFGDLFVVFHM